MRDSHSGCAVAFQAQGREISTLRPLHTLDISEIVIDKKQQQLGMNPSTASGRLVKDVLYMLVVQAGQNDCHQCGKPMSRATFSVEHKTPWLDSAEPVKLYFDLDNISFSHMACNRAAARQPTKGTTKCGTASAYRKGCRCDACKAVNSSTASARYTPERRKAQYQRTGK